ncbi:MAG: hypothetical protein Kow00123_01650 [Anaerolineales bacterium]
MQPPTEESAAPAPTPPRTVSLPLPTARPVAVWVILAITGLVFLAMTLAGGSENTDVLVRFGAKVNGRIAAGEYWRFLTPIFIHIGLLHLAFNVYALYALGTEVERLFGSAPFVVLYLLSGFAGVVASFAFNNHLSAGASGAIFGLVGALGYFFARYRNLLGHAGRRQLINIVLVAAYNLAFGFLYPGVDNHGHLGGLLAGVALGWALCPDYAIQRDLDGLPVRVVNTRTRQRRLLLTLPLLAVLIVGAGAAIRVQRDSFAVRMEWGVDRLDSGDLDGARADFARAVQAQPDSAEGYFMLGYVQFAQEDYAGAAASFEKAVALRGDWSEARWNLALTYVRLGQYQDAARHLQVYLSLAGSEAERREAQRLLGELGQYR